MNELERKIEELKQEYNSKQSILEIVGNDIKFYHCKTFVSFEVKSIDEVKLLFDKFKPVNETSEMKTATQTYQVNHFLKMMINNPCQISRFSNFDLKLSYQSSDIEIHIKIPISLINEKNILNTSFFKVSSRKIYDCEYHYFTGVSMKELREMKVRCYLFDTSKVIGYYGGDQGLLDEQLAEKIYQCLIA